MTAHSIFARAAELEAAGRSFVVATVVAVRRPTSARPGASGIVHPDGTIEGWVGGSCAQPVVVREALRALVDGQPRLLRLSKDVPAEGRRGDGIVELVMTCHSGGTLEIYVEPHLPAPVLWVAGTTPIAGALVALGSAAGWRVSVFDPVADPVAFPGAERVVVGTELRDTDPASDTGRRRRHAGRLGRGGAGRRALAERGLRRPGRLADAGRRRAHLAARGGAASRTSGWRRCERRPGSTWAPRPPRRSRCPSWPSSSRSGAGRRPSSPRRGPPRSPAPAPAPPLEPVVDDIVLLDPVCGMTVDRAHARHLAEHDGVVYAFCSMGCRTSFIREPTAYLPSSVSSPG